jgi:hypothetical protein
MMLAPSQYAPDGARAGSGLDSVGLMSGQLRLFFTPIALIVILIAVSGKLISQISVFKLSRKPLFEFSHRMPGGRQFVLRDDELAFGLVAFALLCIMFATFAPYWVYSAVKSGLGLDLGVVNSVGAFSAASSVAFTGFIVAVVAVGGAVYRRNDFSKEYELTFARVKNSQSKRTDPLAWDGEEQ